MNNTDNNRSPGRAETLADQVEKQIYRYIRDRNLTYGDPLPKEGELADALKVSRTITREALSRLKASGIIESRRRRGMVLKAPDLFSSLGKLIRYGVLDATTRREFGQLRMVLEIGLADLVYLNRAPEAMAELETIARRFLEPGVPVTEQKELELKFHARLFEMTGNNVLKSFQQLLAPFFFEVIRWDDKDLSGPHYEHQYLVDALKNGTRRQWREAVHKHFSHYF